MTTFTTCIKIGIGTLINSPLAQDFKIGQEVAIVVGVFHENGIRVYIDGDVPAMLYRDEVFQKVRRGQQLTAYVKKIRPDGKLDLTLKNPDYKHQLKEDMSAILDKLSQAEDGFIPMNDKSNPHQIKYQLKMSKRSFKQAIGGLYKQKKIAILPHGIALLDKKS